MAIVKFNSSSKPLRGKVGGLVFKHYADKVVVTRAPTFSGRWSTAQQEGRKRFALASAYARAVGDEPLLRAKYEKIAARRGLTVRSVVISAYLQGKTVEIETPSRPVRRSWVVRAKPRRESLRVKGRGGVGTRLFRNHRSLITPVSREGAGRSEGRWGCRRLNFKMIVWPSRKRLII